MKNRLIYLLSVVLMPMTPVHSAQWTATAATIQSVMTKAVGGDTINLVGTFGETKLSNKNFASLVTINATAATFSDALILNNISNINIVGGRFGSDSGSTAYDKAVSVNGGANISFTNPTVVGFFEGQGIGFTGTTNASVTGATLTHLQAGIVFSGVTGGSISNSTSIGSVSDGIDIVDSNHIDIGYNTCTGSTPTTGAHPDCVQMFSSAGAAPLDHINIHNNYASGDTQGFDNFGSTPGDSYISIVNNRVDGLFAQGIVCDYCVNSTLTGNTVNSMDGATYLVKLEALYGTNNTVSGNTIGAYNRAAATSTVYYTRDQLIGHVVLVAPHAVGWVPEPAAWMMLIAGFGLIGIVQRRQRLRPAL